MVGRMGAALHRGIEQARAEADRAAVPPGWSYNPSAWKERLPIIGLALVGLGASVYLTLNQVGLIPPVWDPFFGSASSEAVLHSVIEKYILIPDSALGILGYLADIALDSLGDRARWRSMPVATLAFCATLAALGFVSMILVITQGVVVRHWCTLCLVSAAVSFIALAWGFGESLAALQHLRREVAAGHSFWRAFWGQDLMDVFDTFGLVKRAPRPSA